MQELLAEGYSISGVRPIMKTSVDANGDVMTTATNVIVILELKNDTTSRATVLVDLNEGKVTEIVIITRTVIEKA